MHAWITSGGDFLPWMTREKYGRPMSRFTHFGYQIGMHSGGGAVLSAHHRFPIGEQYDARRQQIAFGVADDRRMAQLVHPGRGREGGAEIDANGTLTSHALLFFQPNVGSRFNVGLAVARPPLGNLVTVFPKDSYTKLRIFQSSLKDGASSSHCLPFGGRNVDTAELFAGWEVRYTTVVWPLSSMLPSAMAFRPAHNPAVAEIH